MSNLLIDTKELSDIFAVVIVFLTIFSEVESFDVTLFISFPEENFTAIRLAPGDQT